MRARVRVAAAGVAAAALATVLAPAAAAAAVRAGPAAHSTATASPPAAKVSATPGTRPSGTRTSGVPASRTAIAMMLLDVHQALGASGIGAEVTAAETYLSALPPRVLVGIVTFNSRWSLVLAPTTDRAKATVALSNLLVSGGSSRGLRPALRVAAAEVAAHHAAQDSRLLVLSDVARLKGTLQVPPLPTDAVTWHYKKYDNTAAVAAIVAATGGRVVGPGGVAKLAAAFGGTTTPRPTTSATPTSPSAAAPAPVGTHHPAAAHSNRGLALVALAVFASFVLVVILLLGGVTREDRAGKLAEHIGKYGPKRTEPGAGSAMATAALDWVGRRLRSGGRDQTLAKQLDLAGIKLNPAEFVVLACCGCVALAALLTVLVGNPLAAIAGLVVGALGVRFGVNFKVARRRARFGKQLPDVLQLVSGSLASGFSLSQALSAITREDTQPSAEEFERALAQTRYGVELETTLTEMADRMGSVDLRWAVMAIRIQRTVGGNLAEVLSVSVATMRERATLRGQVRALSAEGRLSGLILILMPIAIGGWLYISRRSYLATLWTTTPGIVMLVGAVVMMVVGTIWMRKLVKIEV